MKIKPRPFIISSILLFWLYSLFGLTILYVFSSDFLANVISITLTLCLGLCATIISPLLICLKMSDDELRCAVKLLFIKSLIVLIFSKIAMYTALLAGSAEHGLGWLLIASLALVIPILLILFAVTIYRWLRKSNGKISGFFSMFFSISLSAWSFLMINNTVMSMLGYT